MVLANDHIHLSGTTGQTPTIRDTEISVAAILKLLQEGHTIDAILAQYPALMREDVQAAIGFASDAMQRYIEMFGENTDDSEDEIEEDDYEDSDEQIREGIKQGWRDAMRGEGIPLAQLSDALKDG